MGLFVWDAITQLAVVRLYHSLHFLFRITYLSGGDKLPSHGCSIDKIIINREGLGLCIVVDLIAYRCLGKSKGPTLIKDGGWAEEILCPSALGPKNSSHPLRLGHFICLLSFLRLFHDTSSF